MFFRKKGAESIRKIDKVITGIVLGGIIAGAFGYSAHRRKKLEEQRLAQDHSQTKESFLDFIKQLVTPKK